MKPMTERHLAVLRRHMVEVVDLHFDLTEDELGIGTLDPRVREAMLRAPRHLFVPEAIAAAAYQDTPLPIGFDKTISQPFIAALMLHLLEVEEGARVLEIGTGLGYQTMLLAELGAQVWSVEVVEEFAEGAAARLAQLGFADVTIRIGDGSKGWAEHAPFDRILVSAAAAELPNTLLAQLTEGGRIVMPVGPAATQRLTFAEREGNAVRVTETMPVRFTALEV